MALYSETNIDILTEGCHGKACHLEVLLAPGNSDNSDAEQNTEENMTDTSQETTEDEPQNVHRDTYASGWPVALRHRGTKRPQAEQTNFKRLQRPRYAYNSNSQSQTTREVTYCRLQTAAYQPNNITKYFHLIVPFILYD